MGCLLAILVQVNLLCVQFDDCFAMVLLLVMGMELESRKVGVKLGETSQGHVFPFDWVNVAGVGSFLHKKQKLENLQNETRVGERTG
jgi:hypothetical protein